MELDVLCKSWGGGRIEAPEEDRESTGMPTESTWTLGDSQRMNHQPNIQPGWSYVPHPYVPDEEFDLHASLTTARMRAVPESVPHLWI